MRRPLRLAPFSDHSDATAGRIEHVQASPAHAAKKNEPYRRAGLFSGHLISRFDNLLGRTMWNLTPRPGDVPFLILAGGSDAVDAAAAFQAQLAPPVAARLALWGTLAPADGGPGRATGMAVGILAPDETAVRTVLAAEPVLLGGCPDWQLHAWEFGGRR